MNNVKTVNLYFLLHSLSTADILKVIFTKKIQYIFSKLIVQRVLFEQRLNNEMFLNYFVVLHNIWPPISFIPLPFSLGYACNEVLKKLFWLKIAKNKRRVLLKSHNSQSMKARKFSSSRDYFFSCSYLKLRLKNCSQQRNMPT